MISSENLKMIKGGDSCSADCLDGSSVSCSGHTCSAVDQTTAINGHVSCDAPSGPVKKKCPVIYP